MSNSAAHIVNAIGRKRVAAACGVSVNQIGNAVACGRFPARWYKPLLDLAREHDVALPMTLFNWAKPKKLGRTHDAA